LALVPPCSEWGPQWQRLGLHNGRVRKAKQGRTELTNLADVTRAEEPAQTMERELGFQEARG
jgi:hypothetical protein